MPSQTLGGGSSFPILFGTAAPAVAAGVGVQWDVGIDGEGFMLSTLDQESPFEFRAYTLASVPRQKNRFDTSEEPGEQTFDDWWSRAQHSWHKGAGQDVFDADNSTRFAFRSSFGLDIWTDGRIKLLKDTKSLDTATDDNYYIVVDNDKVYYSEGGVIVEVDTLDFPTPVTKSPSLGDVLGMASDGEYLYCIFATGGGNGIQRIDMATFNTDTFSKVNNLSPEVFGFVKGRIIAGSGKGLHEITDLTSLTDGATAFFNHLTSEWEWTSIAEASVAIYAAGYAMDLSEIYAIGYDASDVSTGLTIGAPRLAWSAPEGEIIRAIKGFLGKGILIGTSKGVRVGLVTDVDGELEVSPLIVETPEPVYCFTLQDDYAWFGWSKFDSTYSGLGRIHLGDYSYASDLMYAAQGIVRSVADYNGRLVFSVTDTAASSALVVEEATKLVAQGWFRTGEIRLGTFEDKRLNYFDARLVGDGGTLGLDIDTDDGGLLAILSDQAVGQTTEPMTQSGTRFEFKIYLNRDSSDNTIGPELTEWRGRWEPLAVGRFRHFCPVMLYDKVNRKDGRVHGFPGFAAEKLAELEDKFRNGTVFFFQRPGGTKPNVPPPLKVRIESLQFKSFAPPQGVSGPGGIALVVMKEQG